MDIVPNKALSLPLSLSLSVIPVHKDRDNERLCQETWSITGVHVCMGPGMMWEIERENKREKEKEKEREKERKKERESFIR
jgi:hypothetical protein